MNEHHQLFRSLKAIHYSLIAFRLIVAWRTGFVVEFMTNTVSKKGNADTEQSEPKDTAPCLVRALFEQRTEQQNEFAFYLRGYKDELQSAAKMASLKQLPEDSVVALLEKLAHAMDTLFSAYVGIHTACFLPRLDAKSSLPPQVLKFES